MKKMIFLLPVMVAMTLSSYASSCKTGGKTLPDGVSPTMNTPLSSSYSDPSSLWKVGSSTINSLKSIMASINSSDPITGIYGYYGYASSDPITNYSDFEKSINYASNMWGVNAYNFSTNQDEVAHTSGDPSDFFEVTTQSGQVYQIQQQPKCDICTADSNNPAYAKGAIQAVNTTTGAIIK